MAEEGVVQVFLPNDGAAAIVGVVGALQLDVLDRRLNAEYGLPVTFEQSRFEVCRWVNSDEKGELDKFVDAYPSSIARDLDGAPVFMASSAFNLRYEQERWPKIVLLGREGLSEGGGVIAPLYLENFLYFSLCGITLSIPSRRFLSSS